MRLAAVIFFNAIVSALSVGPSPAAIEKAVITALNAVRDSRINPALDAVIPDPLEINVSESGDDSKCFLKIAGHCTCHAKYDYGVTLKEIKQLDDFKIIDFTRVTVDSSGPPYAISITGNIATGSLTIDQGSAHAHVGACGIHETADGHADTKGEASGTVKITATGNLDSAKGCIQLSVTSTSIDIGKLSLHDTHVTIKLGKIPVSLGTLADLVLKMVPGLTTLIADALQKPISKALPKAITGAIPCIIIPTLDTIGRNHRARNISSQVQIL